MRRAVLAFAAALALLPAGGASATSIAAARPHDPTLGCKAIKAVIARINKGRLRDPRDVSIHPNFYSDAFGEVEEKEEEAFLHGLRHSEGRRDRRPMRLYGVFTVHKDEHDPIYLVVLDREAWHETRLVMGDMNDVEKVADPHYATESSYWLVGFSSSRIRSFREAPETYRLMGAANRLENCRQD
jgi:hypothetical protein